MRNNQSTSLSIPRVLIQKLQEHYKISDVSKSIRNGLMDFLQLPLSYRILSCFALHQLTTIFERRNRQTIALRLPMELMQIVERLSSAENFQDTVTMMLAQIIYTPLDSIDFSKDSCRLLAILGSKWDIRMQDAIRNIFLTSGRHWINSVETCAGGLGIHANIKVADNQILNDDDWRKINLYRAIQSNPNDLLLKAASLNVNEETFKMVKEYEIDVTSKIDVIAAAYFLYSNINGYRHEDSTFSYSATYDRYLNKLSAIYPLHKILRDTAICEMDILKVIDKYRKMNNSIFIVDPPYLETNVYKQRTVRNETSHGKDFDLAEHKKLAKLLRLVKQKNNNDFIYFCRITATRKKDKKNQIVSTSQEILENDRNMLGTIDDLYYGHGFYYMDVDLDDGTVERIITSFPFDDAISYK